MPDLSHSDYSNHNAMPIALLIWFTAYTSTIVVKFGWLDSISRSWYKWKEKNYSSMFTWFCYGLGLFLLIFVGTTWPDIKDATAVMLSFGAASIAGVGIAANYKDLSPVRVDRIHYALSGLAIGCCLIGLWIELSWLYAGLFSAGTIAILVLTKLGKFNNAIFWIEVLGFYTIDVGLFVIRGR